MSTQYYTPHLLKYPFNQPKLVEVTYNPTLYTSLEDKT